MKFIDGMVWFTYQDGHQGWFFKKTVVPDMSNWSLGASILMARNLWTK